MLSGKSFTNVSLGFNNQCQKSVVSQLGNKLVFHHSQIPQVTCRASPEGLPVIGADSDMCRFALHRAEGGEQAKGSFLWVYVSNSIIRLISPVARVTTKRPSLFKQHQPPSFLSISMCPQVICFITYQTKMSAAETHAKTRVLSESKLNLLCAVNNHILAHLANSSYNKNCLVCLLSLIYIHHYPKSCCAAIIACFFVVVNINTFLRLQMKTVFILWSLQSKTLDI